MLNLTSSMAVAFRHLAQTGFRPTGDLIFFGVGDEEAGGVWGAEWMAEHHWDAIDADYVLIGSANLDPRSLRLNFELGVEAWDEPLCRALRVHVDASIAASRRVPIAELDSRSLPVRVRDSAAALLSPYL